MNWKIKTILFLVFSLTNSLLSAQIAELRLKLKAMVTAEERLEVLELLGENYAGKNTDSAFYYADQALIAAEDLSDVPALGRTHFLVGRAEIARKHYVDAELNLRLSLDHFSAMGNLLGLAQNYYALGQLFAEQTEQDSADLYFDRALEFYHDSGDEGLAIDIHLQYGFLLVKWENYAEALEQGEEALKKSEGLEDKLRIGYSYDLLGDNYRKWGENRSALRSYRSALLNFEQMEQLEQEAGTLKDLALVHQSMGKENVALDYAKKGLKKAHLSGSRAEAMDLYKILSDLEGSQDHFQKAYDYSRLHDLLRDSLLGNAAASDLSGIVNKYEQEKLILENENKAQEIKLSKAQIDLQKQKLATERNANWGMIGGLAILSIFIAFMIYSNVQRKKANRKLIQALENLKRTQTQLLRSEKLASLGQVTAGIAHEIQNPLNFVNNLSQLSSGMVDELSEELTDLKGKAFEGENAEVVWEYFEDLKTNSEKIELHGKRASRIVKDMLEHVSLGEKQRQAVNLNVLVDEYLKVAFHGSRSKHPDFDCGIEFNPYPEPIQVQAVASDLGRALLNLFSNGFDAIASQSPAKPLLRVSLRLAKGQVVVSIADNGAGIAEGDLKRIFDPFFTTKAPNEGTGLGLSLAHETIVQGHQGSVSVESSLGKGSTFLIRLPV